MGGTGGYSALEFSSPPERRLWRQQNVYPARSVSAGLCPGQGRRGRHPDGANDVMLGMAGLAIDIGFALYKQRQMQSAADAAAFSAAIAKSAGYPAAFSTEAYAVAGQVGFVNGSNLVTVTVNNPPVSPPASAADAANASAVQVIIQQPQTLPLVGACVSSRGIRAHSPWRRRPWRPGDLRRRRRVCVAEKSAAPDPGSQLAMERRLI